MLSSFAFSFTACSSHLSSPPSIICFLSSPLVCREGASLMTLYYNLHPFTSPFRFFLLCSFTFIHHNVTGILSTGWTLHAASSQSPSGSLIQSTLKTPSPGAHFLVLRTYPQCFSWRSQVRFTSPRCPIFDFLLVLIPHVHALAPFGQNVTESKIEHRKELNNHLLNDKECEGGSILGSLSLVRSFVSSSCCSCFCSRLRSIGMVYLNIIPVVVRVVIRGHRRVS